MKNNEKIFKEEIKFYTDNLVNKSIINKKAKNVLLERTNFDYDFLVKIKNYNEIGIVEYVAKNEFEIDYENYLIIPEY